MQEMRLWLHAPRMAPSPFASAETSGRLVVRTEFAADTAAEAFAERFAGRIRIVKHQLAFPPAASHRHLLFACRRVLA